MQVLRNWSHLAFQAGGGPTAAGRDLRQFIKEGHVSARNSFREGDLGSGSNDPSQIQNRLDNGFQVSVIPRDYAAEDIGISGD
jgi:hypothetical protein